MFLICKDFYCIIVFIIYIINKITIEDVYNDDEIDGAYYVWYICIDIIN